MMNKDYFRYFILYFFSLGVLFVFKEIGAYFEYSPDINIIAVIIAVIIAAVGAGFSGAVKHKR